MTDTHSKHTIPAPQGPLPDVDAFADEDHGLDSLDAAPWRPRPIEIRTLDGRLVVVADVDRIEAGRLARLLPEELARELAAWRPRAA